MSVGIDIGSKTIKIVELSWLGDKPSLKSAGIIGVKNVAIEKIEGDSDFIAVADTIKKLVSDTKISSKDVNISLPESLVFTRNIKFPPLTDQEIASAVKWQAEEIIPIPVKEAVFQYIILDRQESGNPPGVSVLVVAAPKLIVEKYMKVMRLAGLNVVGVETELLAIARSVSVPSQTTLLVDFGAKSTDIAIAKNEKLTFSRTIPTAGDALTRAVSQGLNIDPVQAEEYKKTYGLNETQLEGKIVTAMMPIFRIIVEEIKKTIHFYQTDEKGDTPGLIVISGGSAGLPGLSSNLAKLIGTEVVIANPFTKISASSQALEKLGPYAPLYTIATGLALRKG